jgi:outer membrane autotransporter protein
MKKELLTLTLATLLSSSVVLAEEESNAAAENESFRHKEENVYVVAKGLMTAGHTIYEEDAKEEGKNGRGLGIDLGYRTGMGFNFELDYAYTKLDVTKSENGEKTSASGDYHSFSFDALYAYHINEPLALFVKGGYEYELEKIDKLDVDKSNTGFVYGAGAEYEIKENMALIFEYEDSAIDGPKGYTLAAGLVIGIDILD